MLHLVGCSYYCINDARSHEHQIYSRAVCMATRWGLTNEMSTGREGFSPRIDPWPHVAALWLQAAEISPTVLLSL